MSDYELRQNIQQRQNALRHPDSGGSSAGLWLLGAGIVVILIVALFMFADNPAPVDGAAGDAATPAATESAAPATAAPEAAPAPATE